MDVVPAGADAMMFSSPWLCWFALLALLPWFGPWRGPDKVQNTLRSLLFFVLALAVAQPRLILNDSEVDRVLIVDRSSSVSQQAQEDLQKRINDFTKVGRAHLITIGTPIDAVGLDRFWSVTSIVDSPTQGTSPLSAAISRAGTLIPLGAGGNVTIATDALATRRDDDRAVGALRHRKIPIHWVELEARRRPPTVVDVSWDEPMRKGATARLSIRVVADQVGAAREVLLQHEGEMLAAATCSERTDQVVVLEFEPNNAGFIDAEIVVSDAQGQVQSVPVVLPIQEAAQLLYLGNLQTGGAEKFAGMIGSSFEVQSVEANDPETLRRALQKSDLVVLDDIGSDAISDEAERQIVDAVQSDGLGLVMSGGRGAFGAGGWHNRPIESLLPIEFVQKEEKRDPSTSLVVVIDTSGSMSGVRVQLAKEVARLAMRRLLPHDKVGIVEFYGAKRWAAPLQPASNAIELQRALNRMDAGGGTVILPALEEAFYGLQNVDTRYKHVLVLTDGGVEAGDFESLMRRMAGEGINVSTVLAGGGYHSEFLVNLANWGKGRFYNVPNRFNLPEILLKQPSTTKLPAYRPGTHTVRARGGPGWWGDVDTSVFPNLAGYVESKPRPGSQVLLETIIEKHPILSTWRYGLGRVTTMMTEPVGGGTQPWQQWPEYPRALARIMQRSAADARDPFRYEVEHDGGEVKVHAIRQQPREHSHSRPVARLVHESEDGQETASDNGSLLSFVSRSPDWFIARMTAPNIGETLRMETSADTTPSRWQPLVVVAPGVPEERVDPRMKDRMLQLVSLVGGNKYRVTDQWADAPSSLPSGRKIHPIGSWLFGLALFLFLVEIIWRRLPLSSIGEATLATSSRALRASLLAFAFVGLSGGGDALAETKIGKELAAQVSESVDRWLAAGGVDRGEVSEVFRAAIMDEGSIQPLLDWLLESRVDLNEPRDQVIAELEVHLSSQRGDLSRASNVLNGLLNVQGLANDRLDLVLWQAKLFDALGEVDEARKIYESLLNRDLSESDQQTIRLRLALMGLIATPRSRANTTNAPRGNDAKPLIELAKDSPDVAFRNRAAIVLAVQNKYVEAIDLFTIQGEKTERFRAASRVAEWAIRAQNRDRAIETAWDALNAAQLKRDRNYALALLVESYRLKKERAGLETLVNEFKHKSESDETLPPEVRTVWISLLRELGQYDQAIELFKATANDTQGFSVEMRRELLEMEGEAGYEERMIQSYRQLVRTEPDELTWRSGLTQILLEKGQEEAARSLWRDYVNQTESRSVLLLAAQTLGEFGMDALAEQTVERMVELRANHGRALLYWADLQKRRGRLGHAETTLNRIQEMDDVGDDIRAELAGAYERLGRQDKAIEVNEAIRADRETVAEDLEMRLAWLYSEVGNEERALDQWLALWRKTTSVPRRRYVEDRLMTVASRLGTLADIAIELEEKLADGTADDREAGLLIRIYSRVNDSVAATEISEEYMSKSGKNEVERLQEQGRIYQICNDYWNYEKVIERLIEIDPDGETEYLRQLALSMLERGKAQEARAVLMTLRDADDGKDSIGGEFEAGVLSLVGLKSDAAKAYRRGIATYPDRIESYLLLANILKDTDQTDRAVGMFQYLAEHADKDDLFTIAIDGLLNMEARGPTMQWARRITLERLAGREDKNYLYQLLADLSSEVNDKAGQIRAMENSLAVSGTRRLSVLRECMELSSRIRGGVYYSSSSRGPTNRGNRPFFAFGRRLIGLGELMPPQVFLDLGQAFLDDGDTKSAERTFGMARNLADPRAYQREVAAIFEKAGKIPEALVRYDKLLRTSPSDVALIARVAKLNEQDGQDEVAFRFYQRGLDLLLSQTPLTTKDTSSNSGNQYWAANRDAYDIYSQQLLEGLMVTVPDDQIEMMLDNQGEQLQMSLQQLNDVVDSGRVAKILGDAPRIEKHSTILRKIYFAFDRIESLELMDQQLMTRFKEDKELIAKLARERISRGRYDSVQRMQASAELTDQERRQIRVILGAAMNDSTTTKLSPEEMWRQFLPVWMKGDHEAALRILRRVDQSRGRAPGARQSYVIVNGMAVMQNPGSASDIAVWMRLAIELGDEGLALQFARSRLAASNPYGASQIKQLFDTYQAILPTESFADLVRYAANLYQDDKRRLADYLWLVSQMPQYLGDNIPQDSELLQKIEESDLQINYYFPFSLAMEAFPESIRAEAIAETLDRIVPKYRPREIVQIPFRSAKPIDQELEKVLLESLEGSIAPALQDNYLRYCVYMMPRTGMALQCSENREFAIQILQLLMRDEVRKREPVVSSVAQYSLAVVLHQAERTEEALEIVLKLYDSKENISDPYVRYARDWAYGELVPVAIDRFLERISGSAEGGKLTVEQTDQRLALIRKSGSEEQLRDEYRSAIQNHPEQSKYVSAYERWERGLKRPFAIIEFTKQRLEAAAKHEDAEKKVPPINRQLGDLWLSVNHRPKALPLWSLADEKDRAAFLAEQKNRKEAERQPKKEQPTADENKKPEKESAKPVNSQENKGTKVAKKTYPTSMSGVKSALDDEDPTAARETLRKIWRSFPPAVASPYGYRARTRRLNGLSWPKSQSKSISSSQSRGGKSTSNAAIKMSISGRSGVAGGSTTGGTIQATRITGITPSMATKSAARLTPSNASQANPSSPKQTAAKAKARQTARGGLAVFVPKVSPPRPPIDNAWKVLADYPFAVSEMHRIMRSRPGPAIENFQDVSLGILQAKRVQRGDDVVFASLVQSIHEGHVSDEILDHLFTMIQEDYGRITGENASVIDDLLLRLDLTNAKRASQLADLCGRVGQKNRAKALYRHCALLTTTGSVSLATLMEQAKKSFGGDELMDLGEAMFRLTKQSNLEMIVMLDLRSELLDAQSAAERSRPFVGAESSDDNLGEMNKCVAAVPVFSRSGDLDLARACLISALGKHGKPRKTRVNPYAYYSSNTLSLLKVQRRDLIRMFPEGDDGYTDYSAWLKQATLAIKDNIRELKKEIALEALLTIAMRQCERNSIDEALATLAHVTDEMLEEVKPLQLLAIDLFQLTGEHDRALALERRMLKESRLSHLRFGDLLRDTAAVDGQAAAAEVLSELIEWTMDEDLIGAAEEVAVGDDDLIQRAAALREEWNDAEMSYESRLEAARERAEIRRQWKSENSQAANPQRSAAEKSVTGKSAVPTAR